MLAEHRAATSRFHRGSVFGKAENNEPFNRKKKRDGRAIAVVIVAAARLSTPAAAIDSSETTEATISRAR